ncbi:MAG: hypothetical protein PHY43_03720 [Verrucomicrobiales bacterium]|nr:hypothetical protein [Verrucomicrobiales bacterium]
MRKFLPEAIVLCAIVIAVSYGFAQTWTQTSANTYGASIALSADGKTVMSVGSDQPVISTNWGVTWTAFAPSLYFGDIASSADGTKLIAVRGFNDDCIYVSIDSGNSWMPTGSPIQRWASCTSSTDGTKLAAAARNGFIYTSTDSGTTWQTNNSPTNSWQSLASSADGAKLAAAANGGKIYTSTNSGLTWAATSAPSNSWISIASSIDGSQLLAGSAAGTYFSTNSGYSWKSNFMGQYINQSVALSADGGKWIVCHYDSLHHGHIYTSTNSGINWITNNVPDKWWASVASSADGLELLAGAIDHGIWIYQATPSPQLKLAPLDTNLALSWLVPSTNFALQQSLDLTTTDWVTLTNTPTLNLTNLNNELILSPTNSSGFFRLIAQ